MPLDTLLLISCICIVIAIIFYFFHWNRFLAFLIGWGIRLLYWSDESSSIWVEIGSVHFSILTGRILLKDATYHSSNQTIKVVKGQLQWRYWIRRPTSEEEIGAILGDKPTTPAMHCRIQISFQGFEWFLYNRTAAYDDIISKMEAKISSRPVSRSAERQPALRHVRTATSSSFHPVASARGAFLIPTAIRKAVAWVKRQLPNLDPKDLLPLGIEVIKGAIICGNSSTPNLLVAEFQRTEGTFGIVKSRSKLDLYKQIIALKFQSALIRYVRNEGYVDPMTTMGELVHGRVIQYSTLGRASSYLSYRSFIKLWRRLGLSTLTSGYSSDRCKLRELQQRQSTSRTHKKSTKSAEDATPVSADFSTLEYATEPRILEAPSLELSYYADAVGEVPEHTEYISAEPIDIGNGDISPEWGFDIIIDGGFLRYGPWADRQRAELQRAFFPPAYHDGEVTPLLRPGDKRMWTALRVFIELRGGTMLQLPFREASKDWQWDGKAEIPQRQRVREPATIHLSVGDRSSIGYTMPMVMGPSGYQPILDIHLDTLVVTSSLNDIRLVTAESCRVRCELPTPLKWNLERTWIIAVSLRQPILYLIRDHINMFIDIGKDWAAGPPADYQRFTPTVYALEFEMHHFELNMYANDHNIIDKPLIRDENALLTARGAHIISTVEVPLNAFRPESIRIAFTMKVPDLAVSLSLPRWNTNALHAPRLGNNLAKIGLFCISGSYQYFTEIRKEHVEQLKLNFTMRDSVFKLLGWSIRYFMVIRDNYLGSFTQFSTLYEYLDKRRCKLPPGDPVALKYREGKSNMLQVDLMLCIERGTLILPAGLPGYEASGETSDMNVGIGACVAVTVPGIQFQLRLHDYFMEMSLNVDAISGGILDDYPERVTYSRHPLSKMVETFVIDGFDITANRLFGPQPRTATYVCIWEIRVGAVKLLLSAFSGKVLVAAGNAFRLNYADLPNAPATEYLPAVDPDVTFVKFHVTALDVIWKAGHAALMISLPQGVKVDTNDLGGQYHRKVTSLRIPEAVIKVLLAVSSESNRWLEAAEIIADAFLDIYASPRGHRDMTRAQTTFVEEQDRLTSRASRMFVSLRSHGSRHRSGVYLPQPLLPRLSEPVQKPPLQQYVDMDERPTISRAMPSIVQLSGSDTEEGFSEADRDARLAKTRSSTPIASFFEDNQNMTSGDESDNEDLTDASSESDWFDFATNRGMNHSMLMRFSRITRHYTANHLATPGLWNRHPFVLTKDRISLGYSQASRTTNGFRKEATLPVDEQLDLNDDRDLTSYRFKSRNGVNINITPLILPAAIHFEADMEKNPLGPELCIDALMTKYFSNLTTIKGAESCTLFEVSMPSVAVHILQVIDMVDGHPTIPLEVPEHASPAGLDVISVVHGGFDGLITSGLLTGTRTAVKTNFDRFSLTLDISDDNHTLRTASSNEFVLTYTLQDFQAKLLKESLDVIWGQSVIQLGLLGPEYMTATCIALARHAKQLEALNERWNQYASGLTQTIVRDILWSSANRSVLDPLSAIQPSYLVQTGTPQKLRTDIAFRFLFHLRNCLQRLGVALPESLQDDADFDLISLLETRLEALDQDAYHDIDVSFLKSFLPGLQTQEATSPRTPSKPMGSMSIRFARLAIIVLDPRSQPSEVAVTDVQLTVRMRTLEVSQLSGTHLSSTSQTSPKDRRNQGLLKTSATMLFGDVTLAVSPHLMQFAQNILWVRRHYHGVGTPAHQPPISMNLDEVSDSRRLLSLDLTWYFRRLRIQAAAENLVFEFGVSEIRGASSVLLQTEGQRHQCMNHSALFAQIYLRAHSPVDITKKSDQDILASLELTNGRANAMSRQDRFSKLNLRLIFAIGGLQFSVPRSALRLFRFVEEWRADYLPGIEAIAQALLAEVRRAPAKPISRTASGSLPSQPMVQVQGHLSYFGISLQVMHGTWLSWEANRTTAYFNSSEDSASNSIYAFGLQVSAMDLIVSSNPNVRDVKPNTRIKLALPSLSITGHLDGRYVYALALVDFVELKVKPSHWDTLLAVQQKFGQDFNDLVMLVQETHSRRTVTSGQKSPAKPRIALKYNIFLKIRGFRVGLEGRSSTVYLECLDIGGGVNNTVGLAWNVDLSDLAFSLAPRTAVGRQPGFSRSHCLAFVNVDFRISAGTEMSEVSTNQVVQVSVTKIHAVMQPSSIGEVGDFIDHLQSEMLVRKEQRTLELAAFKEKTQSILKTFEIRDAKVQVRSTWLDGYIINVSTRNIGVAFPLTHDQDLELPQTGSTDSIAIRAFLFSIKAVEFGTHRGETGQATIRSLSFQFVSRFRQSVASDFSGENHSTRNRLLYPEMKAQLRSTRSRSLRNVWVKATVSGFILDLDSSIPSYVFSLIDVYHQGKDRMEKFSATVPRTPSTLDNSTEKDLRIENRYTALPTLNVLASLIFLSGKVRVYSGAASNLYRKRSFSNTQHEPSDEQVMEIGAEVFNLPGVSVWTEYRSAPASQTISASEAEPSILMFKSTVHSSQNTLRPTLLPFLTELVSHVETRLRKASLRTPRPTPVDMSHLPVISPASAHESFESVSTMRISFSLRIDQSKLELTCQPDVNVLAGLHWDSGGFVVNISPGAHDVSFTGSVGGLTLGLKHGFLSEDCVKLDARNLAFSVTFSKTSVSSLSLILDTEFLGVVRFSRLQDILCFKAVWLDRIPIFHSQSELSSKGLTPISPSPQARPSKPPFSTIVLVRIRQIKLDIDLGQSISAVTLDLKEAVMRTKLTEVRSEVSIFVTEFATAARGNIAGHAHVANCIFQTIRNAESNALSTDGHNRMLELRMTSGPLTVALESDHQKLLDYRAEPLEIRIFDDWTLVSPGKRTEEKPLRLSFTVMSPEIIAVVTVGTIPKLMSYGNKFTANLDAQRQGASRESKAFRVTRTPKPDNPLSAVAEAMLHSARSRFKEMESELTYVITQHMSLHLDALRLVVFPRTMDDLEIAQFVARDVRARLDRLVQSEAMPGKRDLNLSFSSMTISKYSGLGHPQSADLLDVREWLTSLLKNAPEATIVGLPSMTMHMVSEEIVEELATNLVYDFHSIFVRREGMRDFEDIYITLNVALYSWLTLLRKNLTREMDQVKATTDWRALLNSAPSSGAVGRKKVPSALNLLEVQKSPTMPDSANRQFSPFSPTTALRSSSGELSGVTSPLSPPPPSPDERTTPGPQPFPSIGAVTNQTRPPGIVYQPRSRHIERLTMRQLGEATPDVMHPFFMKKAGFNLEDSLPQYVNEYATTPLEEVMEVLLKLYSRQLLAGTR